MSGMRAEAMTNMGSYYAYGDYGLPQNHAKALDLWRRAGELGYAQAYNNLGFAYSNGRGVDVDKKKAVHYYELAAMMGSVHARNNLGMIEKNAGNVDRAIKHCMISVRGGHTDSLERIKQLFKDGHATKEEYTAALQGYQEYLGEIKSSQRDQAAVVTDKYKYY